MPLMNSLRAIPRSMGGPTYLPSLIALVVWVSFAVYVERNETFITKQEQHTLAVSETSRLRAQVEGYVSADIQLVRGMIAALTANLEMTQAEYSQLVELVMGRHQEFLNIAEHAAKKA